MLIEVSFSLKEFASLAGIGYSGEDLLIDSISTDSREIGKNTLFAALRGEKSDGNLFVPNAIAGGAVACLCGENAGCSVPFLPTIDAMASLIRAAKSHTNAIRPKKIAVTGSVGKTTTKELIFSALDAAYRTRKSESNYNTLTGVVLTMLAMPRDTQAVVCEMGMSARGEISAMSKVFEPDIAVITNIGSSHLESLGTRENIARAKCEILDGMGENGRLVYHGDEPLLRAGEGSFPKGSVSFGFGETNGVSAGNIVSSGEKTTFTLLDGKSEKRDFTIPLSGRFHVLDALAAFAAASLAGVSEKEIREGFLSYRSVGMRQRMTVRNGIRIIEDCYNASPESMLSSLENLRTAAGEGRKAAFLGDMLELGRDSDALHRKVGRYAAENGVSLLFSFGERAKAIARSASDAGVPEIYVFSENEMEEAVKTVREKCREGDTLLVKGSRGMRLERLTENL